MSVIILNYNGLAWLEKCLNSIRTQSNFAELEIIVADNGSTDNSDRLAEQLMKDWPKGRVLRYGQNLGYCEGNNRAAKEARGNWLLFLNNDTWLEEDCLQLLIQRSESSAAHAAGACILEYDSQELQSYGAAGFDLFGFPNRRQRLVPDGSVFMPEGCAYLIEAGCFRDVGGFDATFFMYVDEFDLSWRVWTAGYSIISVPAAKVHHRGAAQLNPHGIKLRTSDTKRFLTNRNGLLTILKNSEYLFLVMCPLQVLLFFMEALFAVGMVRRWGFVRTAYLKALQETWRLRGHISRERRRVRGTRKRSDFWMLRFVKLPLNRWEELQRWRQCGVPKVAP